MEMLKYLRGMNKEEISSSRAWRTIVYIEFEEKSDSSDRGRLEKAVSINYLSPRFSMLKLLSN